jgi:hypothetical protein
VACGFMQASGCVEEGSGMRNRVEMRLRSRGSSSERGPETKCDRLRIRMGWSVADTLYDQYERAGVEAREKWPR